MADKNKQKTADQAVKGADFPKGQRKIKVKKSKPAHSKKGWIEKKYYEKELSRLHYELVKMQYWAKEVGEQIMIFFDGRDAAGKGGIIKRLMEPLNPRGVRLVALPKPSDVEQTQWYFQRYIAHLPSAGEIVIFDRSWYNRANVERVMGFCTDDEYWGFLRSVPQLERMIVNSGIFLLKYWISVSDEEQERRFQERVQDPTRRWKLSPMDLESRDKWVEYSKAKDIMLEHTDIPEARWYQVDGDDKRLARLNCISHILSKIPYEDAIPDPIKLPPRPPDDDSYQRPPIDAHIWIQNKFGGGEEKD